MSVKAGLERTNEAMNEGFHAVWTDLQRHGGEEIDVKVTSGVSASFAAATMRLMVLYH